MRRIPGAPARAAADVAHRRARRAPTAAPPRATLRAAGVNMDLAPVADVGRAGQRARRRAAHLRELGGARRDARGAFAAACTTAACARRPSTTRASAPRRVNTDDAPARIGASLATLRGVDARPFAALIAGGVDAVMVSTAVYPALDPRPAAFASRWVTRRAARAAGLSRRLDDRRPRHPRRAGLRLDRARARCSPCAPAIDLPLFSSTYRDSARAAEGLLAAAQRGDLERARAAHAGRSACWRCGRSCRAEAGRAVPCRAAPSAPSASPRRAAAQLAPHAPRLQLRLPGGAALSLSPARARPPPRATPASTGRSGRGARRRLDERHRGAGGCGGGGVVARALRRRRSRRPRRGRARPGRRAGCAASGRPAPSARGPRPACRRAGATATRPAWAMSQTAASASTRSPRDPRRRARRAGGQRGRPAAHSASWPPAEWPTSVTRARSRRDVVEVGEQVDRRGDVVEGHRPAAAVAAEAAVLDVPRRVAAPREVLAQRAHDELRVRRLPVAAVQHDGDRMRAARRPAGAGRRPGAGARRSDGARASGAAASARSAARAPSSAQQPRRRSARR